MKKSIAQLLGLLLFLTGFTLYILNIYPEITNGDSGELLCASWSLGIAHPPGYPLYLILLKIFISILPVNPALAGNIMSAFFAALSVDVLYFNFILLYRIFFKRKENFPIIISSFFLALIVGFTPILFSQAIITEVYTLNLFLILLINYVFMKFVNIKKLKFLYLFTFLYGLSLTNHQTPILILPIYAVILLNHIKNYENRQKIIFNSMLLFITGIALYSYLIIRANDNPLINWGNPSNIKRFVQHIFRKEYKDSGLVQDRDVLYFLRQYKEYFKLLFRQFNFLLFLSIPGIFIGFKREPNKTLVLLLFWLILSIGFVYISNPRLDRHILYVSRVFYIPSFIALSFFIFIFFDWLIGKNKLFWILSFLFALLFILKNTNSETKNYVAYDFSRNILKTVKKDSALFTVEGDNPLFALAYLRYVEYLRPDIDYCNRYGKIFEQSSDYFKRLISINSKRLYFQSPERIEEKYQKYLQQLGIIYYLALEKQELNFLEHYYLRRGEILNDYMDKGLASIYYYRLAYFYKDFLKNDQKYRESLLLAAKFGDELKDIQYLLGRLYYAKKEYRKAKKYFKRVTELAAEDSSSYFYYGMCELKNNNFDNALKYLLEAYKLGDKSAEIYKAIAFSYYKTGRLYEAIIYIEEAIKKYPDDENLCESLRYYNSIIE